MAAPILGAPTPLMDAPVPAPPGERYDVEALLKRHETLKGFRATFDTHWQSVAERTWPDWADFTTKREQGERRTQLQFESTSAYALERFAAVLETFLTPRAQTWHGLRASDEKLNDEPGVKEWFDDASRILHDQRARPESGFYGAMQVGYKSHGAFGNAAIGIEPSARGRGIVYVQRHIKDVWISHDHQGKIDTVYEEFALSLRAAKRRYGPHLTPALVERCEQTPFEVHTFVRCIFPRDDYHPMMIGDRGMPFVTLDIDPRHKHALSEGGFFELPVVYSRYTLNPNEDYGRGPAMVSFADNLTLQEMMKTHLRAGELIAFPPLLLPEDGALGVGGRTVDLRSGAMNYGGIDPQGRRMVEPLLTGGRIDVTFEMMQQQRQNIRSAMLLDLFEILAANPQMTATQAMLVAQERGVITAPIVGRLQQEMLGPIIHRELGLAYRLGLLPPVPDAIREAVGDYRVEYTSPATRSQRIEELVGVTRTIEIAAPWIQTNPEYLEVLDGEEVMRLAADVTGVPAKVVRTKEQLAEVRAAQQEARQQQDQAAAAPDMAKAAQSAAAAAKDAQSVPALARGLGLA